MFLSKAAVDYSRGRAPGFIYRDDSNLNKLTAKSNLIFASKAGLEWRKGWAPSHTLKYDTNLEISTYKPRLTLVSSADHYKDRYPSLTPVRMVRKLAIEKNSYQFFKGLLKKQMFKFHSLELF